MNSALKTNVEAVLEQARSLAAQGLRDEAGLVLKSAVDENPESVELLTHLGCFYYQCGRYSSALEVLHRRIQLVPPDSGICRILVDIHESRQQWEPARFWLEKVIEQGEGSAALQPRLQQLEREVKREALAKRRQAFTHRLKGLGKLKSILQWININLVCLLENFLPRWSTPEQGPNRFFLSGYLRFARRYDSVFQKEGIAYHKAREVLIASRHLPIAQPQALILDLGTGKNSLPLYWSSRGSRVIALDGSLYGFPSLKICLESMAKDCLPHDFSLVAGDARRLPFADNLLDGVSALCAIEHIPLDGDIETMKEIFRVLKPGGLAVVTVETNRVHREEWLQVPYEIGFQAESGSVSVCEWSEFFCRNYSPETMLARLAESAPWLILTEGYYDETRFPFRRWLDPYHRSIGASLLRPFQPLLSLCFYRLRQPDRLTPSSIGYLVLQKPL